MAEYIKREAALQIIDYAKQLTSEQIVRESGTYELLSDTGKACYDGIITALAMCKRLINEAVIAADVQPVRRGRWIEDENGFHHCSECKKNTIRDIDSYGCECGEFLTDYCSHCGADMRSPEAIKG